MTNEIVAAVERNRFLQFVCWFSRKFFDIHDYPVSMGGDGLPSHFHTYQCHRCKKEFTI